jgi:hypothetical protein
VGTSSRTVQKQLERICRKLDMETRTAAAMRAGGLRSVTGSQDRLFWSGKCLLRFMHGRL